MAFRPGAVGKWLAMQIAGKAVGFALGLPIVTGTLMATLAYIQGLPLAWGFFSVMAVAAFTSTIMNQARGFMVAHDLSPKLVIDCTGAEAALAPSTNEKGYGIYVMFRNDADVPMEYHVEKAALQLDGRIADQTSVTNRRTHGGKIPAKDDRRFQIGVVPTGRRMNASIRGELEITYSYGAPGKLKHRRTEEFGIHVVTDAKGMVEQTRTARY